MLINQLILKKHFLIIDYMSVISIMLIIPEDILFKHMQQKAFLSVFDHQMGGVFCIN